MPVSVPDKNQTTGSVQPGPQAAHASLAAAENPAASQNSARLKTPLKESGTAAQPAMPQGPRLFGQPEGPEEQLRRQAWLDERTELALLEDMRRLQEQSLAFQHGFRANNQGWNATDAEDVAQRFYTGQLSALREKWRFQPAAQEFLWRQSSPILNSGLNSMRAYAQEQLQSCKAEALRKNIAQSLELAADPDLPREESLLALRRSEELLRRLHGQRQDAQSGEWQDGENADTEIARLRADYHQAALQGFVECGRLEEAEAYLAANVAELGQDEAQARAALQAAIRAASDEDDQSSYDIRGRLTEEQLEDNGKRAWKYSDDSTPEEDEWDYDDLEQIRDSASGNYAQRLRTVKSWIEDRSPEERLRDMAVFVAMEDRYAASSGEDGAGKGGAAGRKKENVPLLLALQGVPESALEKIAPYLDADLDNASGSGEYDKFMDMFDLADLPSDLREQTRERMEFAAAYARNNREYFTELYHRWKKAEYREKEDFVKELLQKMQPDFGGPELRIDIRRNGTDQDTIAYISSEGDHLSSDQPSWYVHVNIDHMVFQQDGPEVFARVVSALAHELNHQRQVQFLRQNRRGKDVDGDIVATSLAISSLGNVDAEASSSAYIVQPHELQSHLLQREMYKGILNILK